ncbi:DNA-binding transcriptional regulator Fis [Psychrobacter sp. LV10R520-6]|uniref:DNA-binding transcriptional regulator Fis n=1 Tax=Psychrobacter sp. LV10R520-6 TaxID=1415574 RepID=UPI0024CCE387|nr:DNA-binding transcriptional regulator Fis [Psychrobacter sp. LV10R520-6]SNT69474.1 Fis family transcriptional regulator, factor for inversion stimulation protein [Psychrobacter sp. LV10R520-6]
MAPHAQYPANRFAQSSEHSSDSTDHSHRDDCHHSASDLEQPMSSGSNNYSTNQLHDHLDSHLNSNENNTHEPLRVHVERVVRQYFATLGDEIPTDLYELILKEIEQPLLSVVLEQTRGNQTKCAQILGLNRGTLRKKLKTYDLM